MASSSGFCDHEGPFWVVYEGIQPGIYDSWPKAAVQVNGVLESSHKKFATFFKAIDSFTEYCTFKSEKACRPSQRATIRQPETFTVAEIDRITKEFTVYGSPHPRQKCRSPRHYSDQKK